MKDENIEELLPKLDPRGLIKTDLLYFRNLINKVKWTPDTSIEEIAYAQGQHDVLDFIERTLTKGTR